MYENFTSLFQLGVALNLGFGALILFAEPTRREFNQISKSVRSRLIELEIATSNDEDNEFVFRLFEFNKRYSLIWKRSENMEKNSHTWQSLYMRGMFIVFAFIAFACLLYSSFFPTHEIGFWGYISAFAVNIWPLIASVMLMFFSMWYHMKALPELKDLAQDVLSSEVSTYLNDKQNELQTLKV